MASVERRYLIQTNKAWRQSKNLAPLAQLIMPLMIVNRRHHHCSTVSKQRGRKRRSRGHQLSKWSGSLQICRNLRAHLSSSCAPRIQHKPPKCQPRLRSTTNNITASRNRQDRHPGSTQVKIFSEKIILLQCYKPKLAAKIKSSKLQRKIWLR